MGSASSVRLPVIILALIAALSVFFLNGRALIYYDSAAYLDQGQQLVGVPVPPPPPDPAASQSVESTAMSTEPTVQTEGRKTVSGGRSAIYALAVGLLSAVAGLPGIVAFNLALAAVTGWLLALAILSGCPETGEQGGAGRRGLTPAFLGAAGLLAGCLGSLPFYIAFAMPDLLAPVLIVMIALLAIYLRRLSWRLRILCFLLAVFATLSHPSHLLLAPPLVALAVFVSPVSAGRRLSLAIGLMALVALGGLAERLAFGAFADQVLHRRVFYLPFLTARLVDDGPGRDELASRCPDPAYPTCLVYDRLFRGTTGDRFDAPVILFARGEGRGSYALLGPDEKTAVNAHELAFVRDVVVDRPLGVLLAVLRNTATQLRLFGVEMTVPDAEMLAAAHAISARLPANVDDGRLSSAGRGWETPLYVFHGIVYVLSILLIAALWRRSRLTVDDKALVLVVTGGILLNALICAGVSEPAARYGARVMFLLPMVAAMLALARPALREDRGPDRSP